MPGAQGDHAMKYGFVSAHGYDPGPSQRPYLAGAISGLLATVPAIGVLCGVRLARRRKRNSWPVSIADPGRRLCGDGDRGRRLRALLRPGGECGKGRVAVRNVLRICLVGRGGRAGASVAERGARARRPGGGRSCDVADRVGAGDRILVPFVHRPLHENIERASKRTSVGPDAAAANREPIREQRQAGRRTAK